MEAKGSVAQRVRGRDTVGARHMLGGVLRLFVLVFACFYFVKNHSSSLRCSHIPILQMGKGGSRTYGDGAKESQKVVTLGLAPRVFLTPRSCSQQLLLKQQVLSGREM